VQGKRSRVGILAAAAFTGTILLSCYSSPEPISGQNDQNGTIKIGALFAETGDASFIGKPEADTVRMLVDTLNKDGGVNGRKIELLLRDTQGNPDHTYNYARELINQGVLGIIGPSTSGESMAIKDICQEGHTILLSCAAAESIVDPVAPYVFKTPPNDAQAVRTLLRTMQEMGIFSAGLITAHAGFGNRWKGLLEELAPAYGISFEHIASYGSMEQSFDDLMERLKDTSHDGIINAAVGPIQSRITKAYKAAGLKAHLFQTNAFADIYYIHSAGEASEGILFPSLHMAVVDSFPPGSEQREVVSRFKDAYRKKYGAEPNFFAAHAHDALMILVVAIRTAGTNPKAVRDAVEATKGLVGVGGVFTFSERDHNGLGTDAFLPAIVRKGNFVLWEGEQKQPEQATMEKATSYLPVLAVLDFTIENMSASEGVLITDYLTNAIFKTKKYYVLARNQRENILKEIEYSYSDLADESTQLEMGNMLAASKILAGSLGKAGSKYLINLQLIDVETTVTNDAVSGIFDSIDELLEECSEIALDITDF